jgi:hypothetical protein
MPIPVDQIRVEAALEEVAAAGVAFVERLRVAAVEPLHACRQVLRRCFDEEVVVVREQAVGVTEPATLESEHIEQTEEQQTVVHVSEDQLAAVPAAGDVEDPVAELNARAPWHQDEGRRPRPCPIQFPEVRRTTDRPSRHVRGQTPAVSV